MQSGSINLIKENCVFKKCKSTIKKIKPGDSNWMISDGVIRTPRAGFEYHIDLDERTKSHINYLIELGLLKPVAYITEKEYIWEQLER